jgi:hypothetical protein
MISTSPRFPGRQLENNGAAALEVTNMHDEKYNIADGWFDGWKWANPGASDAEADEAFDEFMESLDEEDDEETPR